MVFRTWLAALALVFLALPARAQYTRDAAATKKIREAIDVHYLQTDFDKAEAVLTATITACADKCSPELLARAWMYVGIVRGSGKNDLAGAKEAFQKAKQLFPAVKLDGELATNETQAAFAELGAAAEPEAPAAEPAAPPAPGDTALDCTPTVFEVETRRSIPVECKVELEEGALELRFKPAGEDWQSLSMQRADGAFRAEIPCDKTEVSGTLRLFVRMKDKGGDEIAAWGSKASPIEITLVESTTQRPPSFSGKEAPARCAAKEDCPPNFPGCSEGAGEARVSADRYPKNWFGLHVAQDLTFVGGTDICTQASQNDDSFACYYAGSRSGAYVDEPYPGTDTGSSLSFATTRVLGSFDRALSANWLAGVRVGYAFRGGPPSGRNVVYDTEGRIVQVLDEGQAFLPFHLEARVTHFFGREPLAQSGLRYFVHAGGGLAQIDAKLETSVRDCGLFAPRGSAEYAACATGAIPANAPGLQEVKLDAWKKLGAMFVGLGGGGAFALGEGLAVQLDLNAMITLPETGFVLEPSLGMVAGF